MGRRFPSFVPVGPACSGTACTRRVGAAHCPLHRMIEPASRRGRSRRRSVTRTPPRVANRLPLDGGSLLPLEVTDRDGFRRGAAPRALTFVKSTRHQPTTARAARDPHASTNASPPHASLMRIVLGRVHAGACRERDASLQSAWRTSGHGGANRHPTWRDAAVTEHRYDRAINRQDSLRQFGTVWTLVRESCSFWRSWSFSTSTVHQELESPESICRRSVSMPQTRASSPSVSPGC